MRDSTPADTRIMTIVHNGLRRDLERVHTALSEWPYPDPIQRVAIVDHLTWVIRFYTSTITQKTTDSIRWCGNGFRRRQPSSTSWIATTMCSPLP